MNRDVCSVSCQNAFDPFWTSPGWGKYHIKSLWKVDDRSTQAFMTAFYRHWLAGKQPVPEAFRSTQRDMRAKYAGAYDWAGFVLIE